MSRSSSQELLRKALALLADKYDTDTDCFFLVVTKDGKNPAKDVSEQSIVGELNVKTLVAFITEAIGQVCLSIEMDPHVFISRYITGAILNEERSMFQGFTTDVVREDAMFDEDFDEEEEAEFAGTFIVDPKLTDNMN